MKIFLIFVVFVFITKEAQSKPFLFSTTQWLYEKFITNSSAPDHSTKNIEDLSEEGPIYHHNKYAQTNIDKIRKTHLQEHTNITTRATPMKMLIEEDKIHFDMDENDKDNETHTEAPGILQRKIAKILNKLQLYSAVRSTIHNVRRHQNGEDVEDDNKTHLKIINLSKTNTNDTNSGYLPSSNTTKRESNNINDNTDNIEVGDEFDERYDEPFVFDDELEDKMNDSKKMQDRNDNVDSTMKPINNNKLSLETGNLGIHIMEIFGSIATLFLSAAYQVGNYASSLTQGSQHQGLPTSEPIEGVGTTLKWKIN